MTGNELLAQASALESLAFRQSTSSKRQKMEGTPGAAHSGKRGADDDENEEEHLAKRSRDSSHSRETDDEGMCAFTLEDESSCETILWPVDHS